MESIDHGNELTEESAQRHAQRRVLLLMPTNTYHAADFLAAAAELAIAVTVGTNGTQALQDKVPAATLTLDFNDIAGATAAIETFAAQHPVHGVVGADDEATPLAAAAAAALGLPHNPLAAVRATRSKLALRRALAAAGLPSPGFRVLGRGGIEGLSAGGLEARDDADPYRGATEGALEKEIGFPCVLKPTFLAASCGVIRADDAREFRAAAERIWRILADPDVRALGGDEADVILVEDYVPGEEYAIEAMLSGGVLHPLALFDKPDPLIGPFFEETIYVTPSRAPETVRERIVDTVGAAVRALGLREGPLHAELRVNEEGAFVIDLAARSIGGLCPRVLRFGTGASLEELILRHALGEDFAAFEREEAAAGVMMIPIPRAGVLRAVEGLDEARAVAGVPEVTITINRGQRLVPLPEGNRYLGFIFARGEGPEGVEGALREAYSRLRFEIG